MLSKPSRVVSTLRQAPLFQILHTSLGHTRDTRGTGVRKKHKMRIIQHPKKFIRIHERR